VYIVSTIVQIVATVWQAKMQTTGDLMGTNILSGVAGAISESIVQMTISDLFFVHQRATMNAIYLLMVDVGSFLAPVAAGYAANTQGWRWIWWWTAIFLGVTLVLIVFFYEETKYTTRIVSLQVSSNEECNVQHPEDNKKDAYMDTKQIKTHTVRPTLVDYPKKSLRERFSLLTLTPGGSRSYFALVWDFVYLLRFPSVAYTALIYGSSLAWFSVILTTLSTYFTEPPYNFTPSSIGLMNLPPFIGAFFALIISASNDWIILQLAKRNKGVFEPEMRLWLALPGVVLCPAGMLLFGLSMAKVSV
jgi:MFS family permease